MKRTAIFLAMIMSAAVLAACEDISSAPTFTEPVDTNYPVTVGSLEFSAAPESVVSLSPAITEIMYELGYDYTLSAVGEYCDYPEDALSLPQAGSAANPDTAEIIKLSPELLISQSPIAKKDVVALEDAGVRVLVLEPPTDYDSLRSCYNDIAALFGGKDGAEEKTAAAFERLDEQIELAAGADISSFVYILSYGTAVAEEGSFAYNMLSYYGENIAAGQSGEMPAEDIIAADPEYLFLAAPRNALNLPDGLAELPAVTEGRVVPLVQSRFERPTTRVADNLTYINMALGLYTLEEPEEASEETPEETSGETPEETPEETTPDS